MMSQGVAYTKPALRSCCGSHCNFEQSRSGFHLYRVGQAPRVSDAGSTRMLRANFTRVCAYDRPGTPVGEKPSRSDPVVQPTTAGNAVADLIAVLTGCETGPSSCRIIL